MAAGASHWKCCAASWPAWLLLQGQRENPRVILRAAARGVQARHLLCPNRWRCKGSPPLASLEHPMDSSRMEYAGRAAAQCHSAQPPIPSKVGLCPWDFSRKSETLLLGMKGATVGRRRQRTAAHGDGLRAEECSACPQEPPTPNITTKSEAKSLAFIMGCVEKAAFLAELLEPFRQKALSSSTVQGCALLGA